MTPAVVQRTVELLLDDRPIDFLQVGSGTFIVDSDYDAFGVEKIFNRRAFAEKFWV